MAKTRCKVCGGHGVHAWTACPLLARAVATYSSGLSVRAVVDTMAMDTAWPVDTLGVATYCLVRQRLAWAGVLRPRGRRALATVS